MRKAFIFALVMLVAGFTLIKLIERDPGYILIAIGSMTIEMSFWIGMVLLIVYTLLFLVVMAVIRRLLSTRGVLSDWMSQRAYSRLLARCQMMLDAGQHQQVIDIMAEQGRLHAQELRLLARAHDGLGNWGEVIHLLPQLRKQKVFGEVELAAFAERAYLGLLAAADSAELKNAWAGFPAEQKKQARLIEDYGRRLLESGDDLEAEKVLTKAIKREWDGGLVAQYGRISGRDPARRLKTAEGWLKQHPEDASLMLCLGRLSLHNNLWGQAREFFETSHRLKPGAEACAELARLLFSLGERELSAQYYREGLLLRESNLPDLPQPKQDTLKAASVA